jgi:hypothetical protein
MPSKSPVYTYVLIAAATAAVIAIAAYPGIYEPYVEGGAYFQTAQGHSRQIYKYYAGRMLHPLAARIVATVFHVELHRAFLVVAVVSLFALFVFLGLYLRKIGVGPGLLVPLVSVPATVTLYRGYYFHDLFHAMPVAAFFLVYAYSAWAALPILFLLHLTRESTILLSVLLAILSLRRRDWAFALCVLAVAAAGTGITRAAGHAAIPNKHGVSTLAMYFLKVPYAFCYNFLGLVFWTDTNASTMPAYSPEWVIDVSGRLGSIRQVGFCGFHPGLIVQTLAALLVPFGVGPGIAARLIRERWGALLKYDRVFLAAFAYGATCLILAPLIGPGPARYVLYAWPLYWLALPELLKSLEFTRSQILNLLSLQATACMAGILFNDRPGFVQLVIVAVLIALNMGASVYIKSIHYHIVGHGVPEV